MEIFIKVDDSIIFEDISEKAEYMIREIIESDKNSFIEHYFNNGIELLDFIDDKKLLRDTIPYLTLTNLLIYSLANKFYKLGV